MGMFERVGADMDKLEERRRELKELGSDHEISIQSASEISKEMREIEDKLKGR
jgi:hypothetical protein